MKLMLADQHLVALWAEHRRESAQLKAQQLGRVENSSWGERWDRIKQAGEGGEFERHGKVALVNCVGVLDYKYDIWAYLFDSSCYMGIMNKVKSAVQDTSIEKIVLYCDSPGGYSAGLLEASDAIHQARSSKEVVAVVDPDAYSAGYWLASQATRIVAIESGGVGSLGSQVVYASQYRYLQQLGIDIDVIRASISPNKNAGHPYEKMSDEGRKDRQERVDYMGQKFVEHVARGRGVTSEAVLERFGQGKTFFARQAIANGMIDSIGDLAGELADVASDSSNTGSQVRSYSSSQLGARDLM